MENQINLSLPCYGAWKPRNRNERRQMGIEFGKVMTDLAPIEAEFYDYLFNSSFEYSDLYRGLLREYELTAAWSQRIHNIKRCKINDTFFYENFAPIEEECKPYVFKNEKLWNYFFKS